MGQALGCVRILTEQMTSSVPFSYMMEICLQINLQRSLYAINRFLVKDGPRLAQKETGFSIGVSVVMMLLEFNETSHFLKAVSRGIDAVKPEDLQQFHNGATFATILLAVKRRVLLVKIDCCYGDVSCV